MKFNHTKTLLTAVAAATCIGTAQAGSIDSLSTSFNGLTNPEVSTAGALDWGFVSEPGTLNNGLFNGSAGSYSETDYGALDNSDTPTPTVLTTVDATPSIGNVTVTEGSNGLDGSTSFSTIEFDDVQAYGGFRNLAPSEEAFTVDFNDLGVGTFTITLYLGHSSDNRTFRMDAALSDGGPDLDTESTNSGVISGLGSTVAFSSGDAFTYDITFTTTSATEDLSLTFTSLNGGSGDGMFAGYIVVPEPSSLALLGLGGLLIARRRRG